MTEQMRIVRDATSNTTVHALGRQSFSTRKEDVAGEKRQSQGPAKKGWGYGRIHAQEKEQCPAYGKKGVTDVIDLTTSQKDTDDQTIGREQ